MKQTLILVMLLIASITLNAQASFKWVNTIGSTANDYVKCLTTDSENNVYATGWFQGTVDFDPGINTAILTSSGSTDIYLSKYDYYGNFIWVKHFKGSGDDEGIQILIDDNKNIFLAGRFENTVDFDPSSSTYNLTSSGSRDIFILKLDSLGDLIWAKNMGGTNDDRAKSLAVDNAGNILMTGIFKGTADFDPGTGTYNLSSAGDFDAFVLKIDSLGNFIWAKRMGGTNWDQGSTIVTDKVGNIYVAGVFNSTVDFDPGAGTYNLSSAGDFDAFVLKIDNDGNFIWAKRIGSTGYDFPTFISIDNSENIVMTGCFNGTVDFDSGAGISNLSSTGSEDVFVTKMDTTGDFIWARKMGGTGSDISYCIALDSLNNIYTTGYYQNTADFDPGAGTYSLSSLGGKDVFISKLNSFGDFVWAKNISGTSDNIAYSITTDAFLNVYSGGFFQATADFDPDTGNYNVASSGSHDMFIHKMAQCINSSSSLFIVVCDSYFSPSGKILISSGTYLDTVLNTTGCDSIITINLTINNNTGDTTAIVCDSLRWYGTTYYTSATPSHILTNAAGCDSVVTLDLTVNYANTGIDTQTACDSLVWIDGNTYYANNNIATHTLTNAAGCDSVVTLDLTVNYANTGIDVQTACDSLLWIDGITYYASNNIATHTLTNAAGCDSVVTLDLTVNYSNTGIDTQTACDSLVWIDGNTYYANNNLATHTLTNAAGCDSLVTLDLTVNYANTGIDVQTACFSYVWIDGNTYTTNNNTATHTISNTAGCDSVVTLDLTINTVDVSVTVNSITLTATLSGASYQWVDCANSYAIIAGETNQSFTPTVNGDYAVIIDDGVCMDTSICYNINGVGINETRNTSSVNIYPNPTKGKMTIECKDMEKVEVIDITGKLVYEITVSCNILNIDIASFSKGAYFVKVSTEKAIAVERIVLE